MLNLDKELSKLKDIAGSLKSIAEQTEVEIAKIKGNEKNVLLSFMADINGAIESGEGLNDIIENIKNYDSNR